MLMVRDARRWSTCGITGRRFCCIQSQDQKPLEPFEEDYANSNQWRHIEETGSYSCTGDTSQNLSHKRLYDYVGNSCTDWDSNKALMQSFWNSPYLRPCAWLSGVLAFLALAALCVATVNLVNQQRSKQTGSVGTFTSERSQDHKMEHGRQPYQCIEREFVSAREAQWCCREGKLLCSRTASRRSKGSTQETFNCMTREVFKPNKMQWCCKHKHLGCTTPKPDHLRMQHI